MIENNENTQKVKQIIFKVPDEIHYLIKTSALDKGITMQKWILRAIMEQVNKEKIYE